VLGLRKGFQIQASPQGKKATLFSNILNICIQTQNDKSFKAVKFQKIKLLKKLGLRKAFKFKHHLKIKKLHCFGKHFTFVFKRKMIELTIKINKATLFS
jgi:hypothetical protein